MGGQLVRGGEQGAGLADDGQPTLESAQDLLLDLCAQRRDAVRHLEDDGRRLGVPGRQAVRQLLQHLQRRVVLLPARVISGALVRRLVLLWRGKCVCVRILGRDGTGGGGAPVGAPQPACAR